MYFRLKEKDVLRVYYLAVTDCVWTAKNIKNIKKIYTEVSSSVSVIFLCIWTKNDLFCVLSAGCLKKLVLNYI